MPNSPPTLLLGLFSLAAPLLVATVGGADAYRIAAAGILDGHSTGSKSEYVVVRDVAVDAAGNLYLVGGTADPTYPTTPGAFDTTYNTGGTSTGNFGEMDAFVTKVDTQGKLAWSTFLGGPNYDRAYAVEVDASGAVIVAGRAGDGFPTTPGVIQERFVGGGDPRSYGMQDAFIAKLTPDGSRLVFSTYFGGLPVEFIRDFDVDDRGILYLGAVAYGGPIPEITPDAAQPLLKGNTDAVYAKLSPDATEVLYATHFGGSETGGPHSDGENPTIRADGAGGAYFLTWSDADDAPTTPNAFQPRRRGDQDLVVARFAPDGSLLFSSYLGGSGRESLETHNMAIDGQGNVFVAAMTKSTDFPVTAGAFQRHFGDSNAKGDCFIAKISPDGTRLLASTYLAGSDREECEGVAVGPDDRVVVTGHTMSPNFPTTAGSIRSTLRGPADYFLSVATNDLSSLAYSTLLGGGGHDFGRAVAVAADGRILVGGVTNSPDFPRVDSPVSQIVGIAGGYLVLAPPRSALSAPILLQ